MIIMLHIHAQVVHSAQWQPIPSQLLINSWADLVLGNIIGNTLTKLRIPAHLNNFTTQRH